MQQLTEGATTFWTNSEEKISKDMPVFYNPVMKRNRDLTLAVLLTMENDMRIGLPLEASGVRAARILHELVEPGHITPSLIVLNDLSQEAVDIAKRNIAHNIGTFDSAKVNISRNEANNFLRSSPGFEYIDVDPFGTPNPFLDSAIMRITRGGIISVTATDTSALAGTYPAATAKKYWAVPSRTWVMHEVGLRILARKVQLIGAQYDKALVPVLSVATDHYYKIFFECMKSHSDVKKVLQQHQYLHLNMETLELQVSKSNLSAETVQVSGPMWTGQLQDPERIKMMRASLKKLDERTAQELDRFLAIIEDESRINTVGFVDLHELASRLKIQALRTEKVLEILGKDASRTHINGAGIKTKLSMQELRERLQLKQAP